MKFMLILATMLSLYIYQNIDFKSLISKDREKNFSNSRVSVTYLLTQNRWLTFDIPKPNTLFKLLLNANIDSAKVDYNREYKFAIEYRVLDIKDEVLSSKIYHFSTKVSRFELNQEFIEPYYYLDEDLTPTLSKKIFVNSKLYQDSSKLQIKIYSLDRDMSDISIRTYTKERNREDKLSYLWDRLQDKSKEKFAKSNVYNFELLQESEKRDILRETFRPYGPLGVKDEDYYIRKLYILIDEEIESTLEFQPKNILTPNRRFLFQVDSEEISFKFKDATIYGKFFNDELSFDFNLSNSKSMKFPKGYIELYSNRATTLRVFSKFDEQERVEYTRIGYLLDENLTFKINHFQNQLTPIQLRVNLIDLNSSELIYSLLDENSKILESKKLRVDANRSNYLYSREFNLSDSVNFFFRLNSRVDKITLNSEDRAIVSLYNRVKDLVKVEKVSLKERNSSESWFYLKPEEVDMRELIYITPEFKLKSEDNLTYTQIYPELKRSDYLFLDFNYTLNSRALNTIYSEVKGVESVKFEHILERFSPKLIYIKDLIEPINVKIYLDNKLYFDDSLVGEISEIELDEIERGFHKIEIKPNLDNIFISNIVNLTPKKRQKRLIDRFKSNYIYFKKSNERESIAFKVYQKIGSKEPLRVKIGVKFDRFDSKSYSEFTILNREYIIYPNLESKSLSLNRDIELDAGEYIFFTLKEDIPKDRVYKIEIESSQEAYFNIYQMRDTKEDSIDRVY